MSNAVTEIRILVAGPNDVETAKNLLPDVVEEINVTTENIRLRLISSKDVRSQAGRPQGSINKDLRIPDDVDVFLGILWNRFGSPTGAAESGTYEEFSRCFARWRETGAPEILMYFSNQPCRPHDSDFDFEQAKKVRAFMDELRKQRQVLYKIYSDNEDFKAIVRKDLRRLTNEYVRRLASPLPIIGAGRGNSGSLDFFLRRLNEKLTELEVAIFNLAVHLDMTSDDAVVREFASRIELFIHSSDPLRQYFPQDTETVGASGPDIRLQLLALLARFYEAMRGAGVVEFAEERDVIVCRYASPDGAEENARALFTRLFHALPCSRPADLPWCMIAVAARNGTVEPIWEKWWQLMLQDADIRFADIRSIADQLKVHPDLLMDGADCRAALTEVQRAGYAVPPHLPQPVLPPAKTIFPISSDAGREGFLRALDRAQKRITLFASHGRTYPTQVFDILEAKLLVHPDPVKVTVLFIDPKVLADVERGSEVKQARYKAERARGMWRDWAVNVLSKARDEKHAGRIRAALEIFFAPTARLGLLKGSLLVDDVLLRLNVHESNRSSSSGLMLHCESPVNLLPLIADYVHAIREFGRRWDPWSVESDT